MTTSVETPPGSTSALAAEEVVRKRALWRTLVGTLEGRIGLGLSAGMLAVIVVGPHVAPYGRDEIGLATAYSGPSAAHLLGTDNFGRDLLSRFLTGGQSVIIVPLLATSIAYTVGASLGMLGAYLGGWTDRVIARLLDLMLALPGLLIVLVLIAGLGRSTLVLILSVAIVFIAGSGRLVRGATQTVVTNDYVSAAQARGERTISILGREVLPNIAGPMIADFSLRLTWAILFVATLNFLGLGEQPPSSNWGLMVSQGSAYLSVAPLQSLAPAAGIALLAVSFNLIADALTHHLTPEARARTVPL